MGSVDLACRQQQAGGGELSGRGAGGTGSTDVPALFRHSLVPLLLAQGHVRSCI